YGKRGQRRTFRNVGNDACAAPIRHRRANPANKHGPIAPKVTPENFEKPTSWQGVRGQAVDGPCAGCRAVKIKRHVRVHVKVEVIAVMPRFTDGVIAEVKCLSARRVDIGAPPVPIVDDWLDGEKMPAGGSESGREGCVDRARERIECYIGIASREKVFALKRAWFVVCAVLVEANVHALKINRPPDEAAGVNAIDVCDYVK